MSRVARRKAAISGMIGSENQPGPSGGCRMSTTFQSLGIDRLSIEERLALAREIWDSVTSDLEREPITATQRQELERRLADSVARPDAVTPWEEIKARALARARP
jgi:putative addiction module component (TIGR02574 family)